MPGLGFVDPNDDDSPLQWNPTPGGNHWPTVDDGIRQPTTPTLTDYLECGDEGEFVDVLKMETIAGVASVSQVRVWAYGDEDGTGLIGCRIWMGGGWRPRQDFDFGGTAGWKYLDFYGIWTQADLDNLKVELYAECIYEYGKVYALYAYIVGEMATGEARAARINPLGLRRFREV